MTTMTKLPAIHRPGRLPGNLRSDKEGEKPKRLTPRQIEETAHYYLRTDCSNLRNQVLELLYQFVALTESTLFRLTAEQVEISAKPASFRARMNAYIRAGLIEPVARDVLKQALRAGMPRPANGPLRAYRLGAVGVEIARIKFVGELNVPLTITENEAVLAHDLICAEAMLQMQMLWADLAAKPETKNPGLVEVRGPRAISCWDVENQKALIEPDGLIIKNNLEGSFQRAFIVEYHNTNAAMHVENKIARYERLAGAAGKRFWQNWGLSQMPYVLVLYRQPATLSHYEEELNQIAYKGLQARYASIALSDVWSGMLRLALIDYADKSPAQS